MCLFTQEISVCETPMLVTLVDGASGVDNQICIGYKHQFDLISERSGESHRLHVVEASKVTHRLFFVNILLFAGDL